MTSVSKSVYIDKLDDIANQYNNTYHRTIKMKTFNVEDNTLLIFRKKLMTKIQNLKLVIMSEFINTKIFLLKNTCQIGLKKFLLSVK